MAVIQVNSIYLHFTNYVAYEGKITNGFVQIPLDLIVFVYQKINLQIHSGDQFFIYLGGDG